MNKSLVSAVVLVAAVSVVNAVIAKRPITKIVIGAYIFLLMLALLDALGADSLASALAWLAVGVVVLDVFPWQAVISLLGATTNTTASPSIPGQGVIS